VVPVLREEFVAGIKTVSGIAADEISLEAVFVCPVVTGFADAAFGGGDAVLDFVATNE
jgi:hypothetical protein